MDDDRELILRVPPEIEEKIREAINCGIQADLREPAWR